jgi:hypothetical protein
MAAVETISAGFPATALRAQLMKVVGLLYFSVGIGVSRATQSQTLAH